MLNILFCIGSCKKYKNRQTVLKNTWLKNQKYIFLSDEKNEESISLTDVEGHESGEIKFINSFFHINNLMSEYEWFFFGDDDVFVNVKKILSILPSLDSTKIHCHILSPISDPLNPIWNKYANFEYPSGGAGILMHGSIVNQLAKTRMIAPLTRYGDITLGIYLQQLNIKMNNLDCFHKDKPHVFGHSEKDILESCTYHYIDEITMNNLWNICK